MAEWGETGAWFTVLTGVESPGCHLTGQAGLATSGDHSLLLLLLELHADHLLTCDHLWLGHLDQSEVSINKSDQSELTLGEEQGAGMPELDTVRAPWLADMRATPLAALAQRGEDGTFLQSSIH